LVRAVGSRHAAPGRRDSRAPGRALVDCRRLGGRSPGASLAGQGSSLDPMTSAPPPMDRRRGIRGIPDRPASLAVAFGFALSLGISTVAIPLLALSSGYDAAAVGFLVAGAAGAQLATRLALPWLLGRFTDRSLIIVSVALMLVAFGLLSVSTALPAFIAAQLAQGTARAIFWTASQTHVIRSGGPAVHRLVDFNLAGNGGTLIGPLLAGFLATLSASLAITAAAIAAGG